MRLDPRQPLGVRDHRHVAGGDEIEHRLGKPRRRDVMRRLQQEIAAAGERRRGARSQAAEQFGRQVRVGAERELQRDALVERRRCSVATRAWIPPASFS